jgi:hypothetical protein
VVRDGPAEPLRALSEVVVADPRLVDDARRAPDPDLVGGTVHAWTVRNVDRRCSSVPPYDPPPAVASRPTAVFSYSLDPQKSWKLLNVEEWEPR